MDILKNKIKAVIFDMDGTILETEHIWWQATRNLVELHGVIVTPELEEMLSKRLSGQGLKNAVTIIKDICMISSDIDLLIKQQVEIAELLFKQQLSFIRGFEQFHDLLKGLDIPTGVATNAQPDYLKNICQQMNFESFFGQNVYCIADVEYRAKPDPALFLYTAEKLGVKPEECIVFEDSLPGFMAAKAAGIPCIAIKNQNNQHLLEHVIASIPDYHHAPEALIKLTRDLEAQKPAEQTIVLTDAV